VLIRLIRPYLRQYRKVLAVLLCLQFLQSMSTLFLPTINANIIDKGVLKGDTNYIWTLGGLMLLITLGQVLFAIGAVFCGARVAMSFGADVRRDLFHRVTGFSAREVGEFGAPSLITRITNDVQQVQMLVLMGCIFLVVAPITIIGGSVLAINEDAPLSLILLVAIPALSLSIGAVYRRMHPQFMLMQIRIDRVNQILREQISGIRVVRAFVREKAETNRFEKANDELTDTALRTGRLMAFMFPTVMLTVNLSSAAAVWIGANRIGAGHMQIGALIAYISYLIQILMAVMMGTFVISMAPRAAVCADRIKEVLDTESSVKVAENPITELPQPASLEFRNASFSFAGAEKAVLTDISFRVAAGETLAIIGSTGSGKTALLNLVVRLFDTTDGQVLINGIDVRELHPDTLHRAVGLVPQKPYLFSGTVASNVRFGDPDADEAAVWRALEIAQARDFVAAMPGGLSARIAQGGTNVSGGQRQRLAIARALAHRPAIYLFDDSFSALDLATDARLRAALAPTVTDAVNVIVAQRVSTIVQADQILVLEQGRAVGLGTHEQLLESCPTYQEIVESQFVAQAEELGLGVDDRPAPSAGVSSP
jgi:ATP-binding cassette, subfamily B, multidrug efflux pump